MDSRKLMFKAFIILLGLIIVNNSLSLSLHTNNIILDLEIVGATSPGIFIPGPCPPGVQCTYDSAGALGIIFRLTYYGESQCNVSDILLWHVVYGFNFTGPLKIPPPTFLLLSYSSYEFIVKKPFVYGVPINIRIQTLQQGDFNYALTINPSISHITDWNPIFPTSSNTGITFSPIFFGLILIAIIIHRRIRNT